MIHKLSTMTHEQHQAYMMYYNGFLKLEGLSQVLEPTPDFDENGLRFPLEYLKKLNQSVIMFPLEIMANYVDLITKTEIDSNNQEFIYNQIIESDLNLETDFDLLNATSIGNFAYVVMHCKNEMACKISEEYLNKIFVKQKGVLLNLINELL